MDVAEASDSNKKAIQYLAQLLCYNVSICQHQKALSRDLYKKGFQRTQLTPYVGYIEFGTRVRVNWYCILTVLSHTGHIVNI